MSGAELSPWLLTIGLACALPALFSSRFGPWLVRVAGLLVLGAVWVAALDRTERHEVVLPPDVVLVATGAADGAGVAEVREAVAAVPDARFSVAASNGASPAAELLAAALTGGPTREVVLLWNAPFDAGAAPAGAPRVERAQSLTTAPPPPIEPEAIELRTFGEARIGRPAAAELRLAMEQSATLPDDARVRASIVDPNGAIVAQAEVAGAELSGRPLLVDWTPEVAGEHVVLVEAEAADVVVAARGPIPVHESEDRVLVVGPAERTTPVRDALAVQGLAASLAEALPDSLDARTVVVASAPLSRDEQERLLAFVEDGGGALLVGDADGGGLPLSEDPLAAASPLRRLPVTEPEPSIGPGEGGAEKPPDPAPDAPDEPAPTEPPPDLDERPEQPPPEDEGVTGDTSAAQADPTITEAEVERRQVALVLVVDRSGSMDERVRGGSSKMDYAKSSAFETASALAADDELAVVSFGVTAHEVVPLGPPPSATELRRAMEGLASRQEGTLIHTGIEKAGELLSRSTAPIRHCVVVTDGEFGTIGDRLRSQSLARNLAIDGVTVSVVQIGRSEVGLAADVKAVADSGKGTFVRETDGAAIPRLVFAEVRRALGAAGRRPSGEADPNAIADATEPAAEPPPEAEPAPEQPPPETPVEEPPVEPDAAPPTEPPAPVRLRVVALEDSRLLEPLPEDGVYPPLHGVSPVTARDGARVLLAIEDGTPLLGFANRGLGRVAAWSSDLSGPWSEPWREDEAFPGRLAEWVEAVRPAVASSASGDRLQDRTVEPRGPLAAERRLLGAFGLDGLAPVVSYRAPTSRQIVEERGRAVDDALFAVLAIVFLAFVEWLARRRGA